MNNSAFMFSEQIMDRDANKMLHKWELKQAWKYTETMIYTNDA